MHSRKTIQDEIELTMSFKEAAWLKSVLEKPGLNEEMPQAKLRIAMLDVLPRGLFDLSAEGKFDIWMEGYSATGGGACAILITNDCSAKDFRSAVLEFCATSEAQKFGPLNEDNLSLYGCRLYDNEADARAAFG